MTVLGFDEVARAVLAAPAVDGTRVVGVDGPSGSGKSTLARRLRARLPGSGLVAVDDFVSWSDPGGWWPRFDAQVLRPLLAGQPARHQVRDWSGDEFGTALGGWRHLPWAPVVLVEGVTCTRREAAPRLAYAIWVEAPAPLRLSRGLARDGADHLDLWQRWMAWERGFFAADETRERADLRVDGDPAVPHDPETQLVLVPAVRAAPAGPGDPGTARR